MIMLSPGITYSKEIYVEIYIQRQSVGVFSIIWYESLLNHHCVNSIVRDLCISVCKTPGGSFCQIISKCKSTFIITILQTIYIMSHN